MKQKTPCVSKSFFYLSLIVHLLGISHLLEDVGEQPSLAGHFVVLRREGEAFVAPEALAAHVREVHLRVLEPPVGCSCEIFARAHKVLCGALKSRRRQGRKKKRREVERKRERRGEKRSKGERERERES